MKLIKFSLLFSVLLLTSACSTERDQEEISQESLKKAIQLGEAQAVVKIIQRAQQNPCQPIYLFNYLDEDNKQEVNLINIQCESLNLPDPSEAKTKEVKTEQK